MKKIFVFVILLNLAAQAASMEETILTSAAGATLCKVYAEEVGGNVEAFSEMNVGTLKLAEKLGYVDDLASFTSKVSQLKSMLETQLLHIHTSKSNVYNNWCIKFYNGFQKGVAKAYR